MSAAATAPALGPHTLDLSGTERTPYRRLLAVELRKTWDTRAGLWLLISIGVLTGLVMVIQLAVVLVQDLNVDYGDFMTSTSFSIAVLLPVLGILLVTSEWSQRTAMVTFSLEPSRARVILAKLVIGLFLAAVAVVVALALGALCNVIYGMASGDGAEWDLGLLDVGGFLLLQALGMLTGFAFAALLLNSPAAIVIFMVYSFVLPGLFALGAALMDWFEKIQPWIDFNLAQGPLVDASMSGDDWAHLVVSGILWLAIPLGIGWLRVLRAEVK